MSVIRSFAFGSLVGLFIYSSASAETVKVIPGKPYGANVTEENGVRVWRPTPPSDHSVVGADNPSINFDIGSHKHEHNYNYPSDAQPDEEVSLPKHRNGAKFPGRWLTGKVRK